MKTDIHFRSHFTHFFLENGILQTNVVGIIKTYIFCSKYLFFENRAVDEMTLKNILQTDRLQMAIWRMPFSYWMSKTTNTHSEYVILIAFPQQLTVIRKRCNVTLHGQCLSCYQLQGIYGAKYFSLFQLFKPFLIFSLTWRFVMYSQQQHDLVCDFPTYFFKTHLNIIFSIYDYIFQVLTLFQFYLPKLLCISFLPHAFYIHLSNPSLYFNFVKKP
jgi:hypothetical protein